MTEENHCYENAVAERVNGILKMNFILIKLLPSLIQAKKQPKYYWFYIILKITFIFKLLKHPNCIKKQLNPR